MKLTLDDPMRALVALFDVLHRDHAAFLEQVRGTTDELACRRIEQALDDQCLEALRACPYDPVLPWVQALDTYLARRYADRGPAPCKPIVVEGRRYFVTRRQNPASAALARHRHQIIHWFSHHWIFEATQAGYPIRLRQADHTLRSGCAAVRERAELRVMAVEFDDRVTLDVSPGASGAQFWYAEGLSDEACRRRSLDAALGAAKEQQADVIVFPELTLSPALRDWLIEEWATSVDWAPMLVLAGSFHELDEAGARVNRTVLLDGAGAPIHQHDKLVPAEFNQQMEDIAPGREIGLIDTPLGLMATPICLDFCNQGAPFNALWQSLGPEWLWVPAMGPDTSMSAHQRAAEALGRAHRTAIVVCNQDPAGGHAAAGLTMHQATVHRHHTSISLNVLRLSEGRRDRVN